MTDHFKMRRETPGLKRLMRRFPLSPHISILMIAAPVSASSETSGELPVEIVTLWPYHASLVILGFLLLVWGMTVARRKEKGWLKKHRLLGISGATVSVAGMTMAAYMIYAASQEHFRLPHAYLGSVVILLVIVTLALGLLQLKASNKGKTKIRWVHRIFGRTTLLLMALNMLFGMLIVSSA
jgi:uncharacterized membrane protein YeaQ/YmgE (transglycosylase-associated protein family)